MGLFDRLFGSRSKKRLLRAIDSKLPSIYDYCMGTPRLDWPDRAAETQKILDTLTAAQAVEAESKDAYLLNRTVRPLDTLTTAQCVKHSMPLPYSPKHNDHELLVCDCPKQGYSKCYHGDWFAHFRLRKVGDDRFQLYFIEQWSAPDVAKKVWKSLTEKGPARPATIKTRAKKVLLAMRLTRRKRLLTLDPDARTHIYEFPLGNFTFNACLQYFSTQLAAATSTTNVEEIELSTIEDENNNYARFSKRILLCRTDRERYQAFYRYHLWSWGDDAAY